MRHCVEGDASGCAFDVVDVVRLQQGVDGQRVQLDLDGDASKRSGRVDVDGQRRVVGFRQQPVVVGLLA